MTNDERIAAITKLGYSDPQATFLCLAALHGGYFLRRQYDTFLKRESGGIAERLIEKAVRKGHVRTHESASRTVICHVGAKPFFEAIGEKDNRNRRWRQPYPIQLKLMGFDYVLAHPECHYLATETEKLHYFQTTLGLDPTLFPARLYRSKRTRSKTTRYFVDKFPIFLSGARSVPPPVVTFCYIDGSVSKPSGFDTYLLQYGDLIAQLPSSRVIYVASDQRIFAKAARIFSQLLGASPFGFRLALGKGEVQRLLEHFNTRQLFEQRNTALFDKHKLDQLREEFEEFRGRDYEALYREWQVQGDSAVAGDQMSCKEPRALFETYLLPHDYSFFGELARVVAA